MPTQTTSYQISPEQWELFRKAKKLTDYPTALAFYQAAARPQTSAFGRRLRNTASQYGGGIGLGIERQGLTGMEAEQASAVTQAIPQNLALAGQLAPPPTQTVKTKESLLDKIGKVTGIAGNVLGLAQGGVDLFQSMKEPEDSFSRAFGYLGIPQERFGEAISHIFSGDFEEWLRQRQTNQNEPRAWRP